MDIYKETFETTTKEIFPEEADSLSIFQNLSPSTKSDLLTEEEQKMISSSIANLSSAGVDLILESINNIYELMIQKNFFPVHEYLINDSMKPKLRPERLLNLLHENVFIESVLNLIAYIISNTSYYDKSFIQGDIAGAISEISKQFNNDILLSLFKISSCLVGRKSEFCHKLFELQFYDEIGELFQSANQETQEEIASFLEKSTHAKSLKPQQSSTILYLVYYLLQASNQNIIKCGFSILKRLTAETWEVEKMLDDGRILQNFKRILQSPDLEPAFLLESLEYLSAFSSLGNKIITLIDEYDILQSISDVFDKYNEQHLKYVIELLSNFFTFMENGLENCYIFLSSYFDIIFIFENCSYNLKQKLMNLLRLSICRACSFEQVFSYFPPDVLHSIVLQLGNNDDEAFCYDGLYLISILISKMEATQFAIEFQQLLRDEIFSDSLQSIQTNLDAPDNAELAEKILLFMNKELE